MAIGAASSPVSKKAESIGYLCVEVGCSHDVVRMRTYPIRLRVKRFPCLMTVPETVRDQGVLVCDDAAQMPNLDGTFLQRSAVEPSKFGLFVFRLSFCEIP